MLDTACWGARNAHDPTVVRGDDGLWYMFSTDAAAGVSDIPAGAHVRTSPDLVDWTFRGTALDGVPQPAGDWSGAAGLWAPEVVRWPSAAGEPRWHMYYSASSFGSRTSAIGLAVASDLAGPWTDQGIVIGTEHERDAFNAIDAAVVFDRAGAPWMIYGSFFGGIHAVELSPETGMRLRDEPGTLIARRPQSVDGAIEGAYVVEHDGRYVLFVSYDSLVDTYSVRVGVADAVTGPYRDQQGRSLLSPSDDEALVTGTKVLGGLRFPGGAGLIAPGHNSIFRDGDATFMVHHVRFADDPAQHEAQVRRVHWTASGWPVVSPHPFAGTDAERLAAVEPVAGEWDAVRFAPEVAGMVDSRRVTVVSDAVSDGEPVVTELVLGPSGSHRVSSRSARSTGEGEESYGPHRVSSRSARSTGEGEGHPVAGLSARSTGGESPVVERGSASDRDETPQGAHDSLPHDPVTLDAVVFGAWDPVAGRPVLAFSGIDADGVVWSGSKAVTP